jgi:phosphatidylglycerophosphate synthase
MSNNTASWDRVVRVVVGLIMIALVFWGPQTAWGWLGLILVATGFVGYCPIYGVLGLSTSRGAKEA